MRPLGAAATSWQHAVRSATHGPATNGTARVASVRELFERQPRLAGEPEHVGQVHAAAVLNRYRVAVAAGHFHPL